MRHVPVVVLVVLSAAFAGCVDDADEPTSESTDTEPPAPPRGGLSYEVDAATANATELEGAHTHDEWGETTEMVLLDETVATAECADPFTTAALAAFGVFTQQEVHVGCASWRLADGAIVPEGTAWLRVEVDATAALQDGGMRLSYANEGTGRETLDATTDPVFTWRIPVGPLEWDLPHSTETSWWFLLEPTGQASVLDGTVEVFVVAERMTDWQPILGSAHIDHWAEDADHAFVDAGVYRALDTNTTIVMSSFADRIAAQDRSGFDAVPLDDIIAPGAAQVTLTVAWDDVANCPAGHACWLVSFISPGNSRQSYFVDPVEAGAGWAVYVFDTPEPLAPDSTYAEESVYFITSFVRACPEQDVPDTPVSFFNGCLGEAVATMEADARLRLEVWDHPADLAAAKARAGIA